MSDQTQSQTVKLVFQDGVVRARCGGVPVVGYGATQILAQSPDLLDDVAIQQGNDNPFRKTPLKTSAEIRMNRLGAAIGRLPRTAANDALPLEPIHLIDGDRETCWSSHPFPQPDAEPVWIRIDLAREQTVSSVTLHKRRPGPVPRVRRPAGSAHMDEPAVEVGMAMARHLTIRVSRDAHHWDTVFDGPSGDAADRYDLEFVFDPRPAKQIWIVARGFPRIENWGHSFSIAAVEVRGHTGRNLALPTLGAGVSVSSTMHGFHAERQTWHDIWATYYDLGFKWVRFGFHDDVINWHYVEQQRGKLAVDPVADLAVTDMVAHGVDVVLSLGFGNRLYTQKDPTRHLPQLWEWYWENPAPPTTPEALDAWARYVRFMAQHFRDRVKVFEVWNEWNTGGYWGDAPDPDRYVALARRTIPILRECCPDAEIMLGSYAGFVYGISGWDEREWESRRQSDMFLRVVRELARDVDIIAWHPFYQADPDHPFVRRYLDDVRAVQRYCESCGFAGRYMVTEWAWGASYPAPAPPNWWGDLPCTEIEKAKYLARLTLTHTALPAESFYCGYSDANYPLDLSLTRKAFVGEPLTAMQPQPAYYVLRNLSTALDGLEPAELDFRTDPPIEDLQSAALRRDGETVLALWTAGRAQDDCPGRPCDLIVNAKAGQVTGYEPINGAEQTLRFESTANGTTVGGVIVRDYPILIRLK